MEKENVTLNDIVRLISGLDTKISGIDAKVGGLDTKISGIDAKVGGLDTKVGGIDEKFSGLDTKFDGLSGRVLHLSERVGGVDEKVSGLSDRILLLSGRVGGVENSVKVLTEGLGELNEKFDSLSVDVADNGNHIDSLAVMTKNGFESMNGRFERIEKITEDTISRFAMSTIQQDRQNDGLLEQISEHEARINKLEDFAVGRATF